ncbi:FHA domain-containing protein [Parahaliea aestuarii]|uniref:FHA domain-containing protein n=1 Tax=Parahaliea aestuarii TaxID=1852021 RepID=A0A5C8ZSB9_9GAMM|nr:FHA domain-containing protein [Parahaliea aestuarii]TXS90560.1 FHA domain-containing protein [Parahaliea aestuarii]
MSEFSAELVAADGSRLVLEGEQRVGRSADCEITIDDPRVSRGHAVLRVKGESLTVEDLGSANGTQVNGQVTSGETTLRDGDSLSFDKYTFVVVLSGGAADMDATVVGVPDSDATVVSMAAAEPPPTPEVAAEPAPAAEPKAEPPPEPPAAAEPAPPPKPAPAPSPKPVDLPGSWTDSGTSDSTRVLSLDAMAEAETSPLQMERASDLPHLILVSITGEGGEALELQLGDGSEPDVWEIGRDPNCEVLISEPSVSARHAQLIHQDGRWRLVNLVSANGIFVNGEKRLTAYLADGDEIRLGVATLIFRTAAGAETASAGRPSGSQPAGAAAAGAGTSSGNKGLMIAVGAVVVVAAAAAAWFLLL